MRRSRSARATGLVRYLALTTAATVAAAALPARQAQALTFVFSVETGTPPPAQDVIDAFRAAGRLWSDIFGDNVTVNIKIAYINFSSEGLPPLALATTEFDTNGDGLRDGFTYLAGPAGYPAIRNALIQDATSPADMSKLAMLQPGPNYDRVVNLTSDHPNGSGNLAPYLDTVDYNDGVLATLANLKALGLRNATDAAPDGLIRVNNLVPNWDFDRTNGIGPGSRDFVATAAHEIAHVLGFKSEIDLVESLMPISDDWLVASVMDLFRFADDFGVGVPDLTIDAGREYFPLLSGQHALLCDSLTVPGGCQASHWVDGMGLGLMDPTSDNGVVNLISANDIEVLDVIGWTLRVVPSPPENFRVVP